MQKQNLYKNKITQKVHLRKRLSEGSGSELIALYKLIGNDEERKALSTNWNENNNNNLTPISVVIERTYETKLPTNQGD